MLQNFTEWAAMGGYGFYVWGCLSVTLIAMLICSLWLHYRHKSLLAKMKQAQNNPSLSGQ